MAELDHNWLIFVEEGEGASWENVGAAAQQLAEQLDWELIAVDGLPPADLIRLVGRTGVVLMTKQAPDCRWRTSQMMVLSVRRLKSEPAYWVTARYNFNGRFQSLNMGMADQPLAALLRLAAHTIPQVYEMQS